MNSDAAHKESSIAPVDPREFRNALGRFMSGITVVSAEANGEPHGMTANAFISVSLDPPLILVSIDRRAHMLGFLARAGRFGVSVLGIGHEAYSMHFSGRPQEGLDVAWQREGFDTPVLADGIAQLDCDVHSTIEAGDHTLYLGRVKRLRYRDGEPLGYFQGKYRVLKPL